MALDSGEVGIPQGIWSGYSFTTELYRLVALDGCRSYRIRGYSSARGENRNHNTNHSRLISEKDSTVWACG